VAAPVNSEFQLIPQPVQTFGGCGVQLNQHSLAQVSLDALPKGSSKDAAARAALRADLHAKIRTLAPHIVRIFFNNDHAGVPLDESSPKTAINKPQGPGQKDRWASFVDTVKLADEIGALINITWQGGSLESAKIRETAMTRFANALQHLVKDGVKNLRWVTVRNEPNTAPGKLKPADLGDAYQQLDGLLVARGLRKQIGFMGGDLKEGSTVSGSRINQKLWFEAFAKDMPNVVFDSISTHIYWNYNAPRRFHTRLDDVRNFLNALSTKGGDDRQVHYNLPVYVTEFGVRGPDFGTTGVIDPGHFHGLGGKKDLTPIYKTTIAPFHAAWFQIWALQMGYAGFLKWDCAFGIYDVKTKKERAYYAIGKPDPKTPTVWQLWPMYHLLRLFTATTARGWNVHAFKTRPDSATKHLVAFRAQGMTKTVIGLHEGGSLADKAPANTVSYQIGGLQPRGRYKLVVWNKGGRGGLVVEPVAVTASPKGIATVHVPMRAVFALTSKELPSDLGG
jgi:hypothetical protein